MTATNIEYTRTIMSNAVSGTKPEKSVVMFHIGRSGSTVLGHLFNQNDNIFWDSEIFMRNRMLPISRPFTKVIFSFPGTVVRTRRMRTTKPIYGFEAKLAHVRQVGLSLPEFVTEMKELGFEYFIVLRRHNQLRSIISHLMAKQQGYWHKGAKGDRSAQQPTVHVDVNAIDMGNRQDKPLSLIEHINTTEENFHQLHELLRDDRQLELIYEEHIEKNPTVAYENVCQFLDIEPSPVDIQLKKTNPWPIHSLVDNYDELAATLAHSPYEWMLESDS